MQGWKMRDWKWGPDRRAVKCVSWAFEKKSRVFTFEATIVQDKIGRIFPKNGRNVKK